MPRIARNNYQSKFFHIMTQGINKEHIFQKNTYKEYYLELLKHKLRDNDIKLISYCIMDNHAHILLFVPAIKHLSEMMSSVNTKYAMFYNNNLQRCGYVFRDRYKCEMIMDKTHLQNCIKYIHDNPVKAGICSNPIDYEHSSYRDYFNDKVCGEVISIVYGDNYNYKNILSGDVGDYKFIEIKDNYLNYDIEIKKLLENNNIIDMDYYNTMYRLICELKMNGNLNNIEIMEKLKLKKSTYYRIIRKQKIFKECP